MNEVPPPFLYSQPRFSTEPEMSLSNVKCDGTVSAAKEGISIGVITALLISSGSLVSSGSGGGGTASATPSAGGGRSEEHTYERKSLMRISYAVLCLKKKKT